MQSFPVLLLERKVSPGPFVEDLLSRAVSKHLPPSPKQPLDEVLDMMACKAAIKAGIVSVMPSLKICLRSERPSSVQPIAPTDAPPPFVFRWRIWNVGSIGVSEGLGRRLGHRLTRTHCWGGPRSGPRSLGRDLRRTALRTPQPNHRVSKNAFDRQHAGKTVLRHSRLPHRRIHGCRALMYRLVPPDHPPIPNITAPVCCQPLGATPTRMAWKPTAGKGASPPTNDVL